VGATNAINFKVSGTEQGDGFELAPIRKCLWTLTSTGWSRGNYVVRCTQPEQRAT